MRGTVEDKERDKKRRRGTGESGGSLAELGDELTTAGELLLACARKKEEPEGFVRECTDGPAPSQPEETSHSSPLSGFSLAPPPPSPNLTRTSSATLMPPPPVPAAPRVRDHASRRPREQFGTRSSDRGGTARKPFAAQSHRPPQQPQSQSLNAASSTSSCSSSSRRPFLPPQPQAIPAPPLPSVLPPQRHPPPPAPSSRLELITPPNPPSIPGRLSPDSPNPSWLEEALYGPAFRRKRSREQTEEEEELELDWTEFAGVYSAVVEHRLEGARAEARERDEQQEGRQKGKQKVKEVGEGMRKRLGKLKAEGEAGRGGRPSAYEGWEL